MTRELKYNTRLVLEGAACGFLGGAVVTLGVYAIRNHVKNSRQKGTHYTNAYLPPAVEIYTGM